MSSWHLNPVYGYMVVAICGGLLLALMMGLSAESRRLGRAKHWTLFGLRLIVFLLLILVMLRPTLVTLETKSRTASIDILIDRTRSMNQEDELNGKSRWAALYSDLQNVAPLIQELAEKYELEFTFFDEQSTVAGATLDKIPQKPPEGKLTAIGGALEDTLRRSANKRLAAVLLFSDGAQQALPPRDQPPQTPARRLGDLGTPLYTFVYGQERALTQTRDAAVVELLAGPTVYVKNVLTVTGTIRAQGLVNQPLQVKVLYETKPGREEIVAAATLTPTEDGQLMPIELKFIPETPGEHKLTLRVDPPPGIAETTQTNNQLSTYVTVLEGGINVLYLEGEPRVEARFLRRALNASPDMRVDFEWIDAKSLVAQKKTVDLGEQVKPGKYDCYILGDLDSEVFRPQDLAAIAANVDAGAGLILLGGYHTYWPGGYQNTQLARVMPLEFDPLQDRLNRQSYGDPLRQDLHLPGPLTIIPDKQLGRGVPFMQLAPSDKNDAFWRNLPPLKGANKWRLLKPAAKVLARTQNGEPLIAALEPGNGRVLAIAGDSTWTWAMRGNDAAHKTFWRQALLWTLKIDESQSGSVWVLLEQRRILPGRRVNFTAGMRGGNPEISKQAKFTARVTLPGGKQSTVSLASIDALQTGSFGETNAPGEYQVEVVAEREGQILGTAKARFIVLQQDPELDNPVARPGVLAGLAQITAPAGGQALNRGELRGLLERLRDKPPQFEIESEVKHTPWDRPETFLAIVTILIVEWYLRKKWGLV